MLEYRVQDLMQSIGTVAVMDILLVVILSTATYQLFKFIHKYGKLKTEVKGLRKQVRSLSEDRVHTMIKEVIENIEGDEPKEESKEEIKRKRERQEKLKKEFEEKRKEDTSVDEEETSPKAEHLKSSNGRNESGSYKRGMKPCTDREDYPKVFDDLLKVTNEAISLMTLEGLAKAMKVSTACIHSIIRGDITTRKTAEKHNVAIRKAMSEFTPPKATEEELKLMDSHDLASQEELRELAELISYCLSKMTQTELALRLNTHQSAISYISGGKIVRRKTVLEYIKDLTAVKSSIKGREDRL